MAARDRGGIPWDKPVTLRNILNATAVEETNDWKDVGVELGIETHVLGRIEIEYSRVKDRKREMFIHWLDNNTQPSWNDVNHAVKTVRKRSEAACEREDSRRHIQEEERKAVHALHQTKESLEKMDTMNTKIADNRSKLAKELKEQKGNWESSQSQWREEDLEWKRGEKRRKETKQALEGHNLQGSQFVKEFLRRKGLPDNLSDQEVECYLRKDILEEEVTRSRQLRLRNHQVQKHHKELQYLLGEAKKWKELVEDRVTGVYTGMLNTLEQLGMQPKNLRDLEKQLTELKTALNECEQSLKACDQTLKEGEEYLSDCERQLTMFTESFGKVVEGMEKVYTELENEVEQYRASQILAVAGV